MTEPLPTRMASAFASNDAAALVAVGCELSDTGDHINAARCFRAALDLGAEWVAFNLANELVDLDRGNAAIEMYERAIAAGEANAYLNLGQVLEDAGDLAGALEAYHGGEVAGDLNAGVARAFLLRQVDRRAEAELVVQDLAVRGSPLADAIAACWEFERTQDPVLEDRLRAGQDLYPSARADLAELLRRSGRHDEAVAILRRGTELGESDSFLPLGNIYLDDLDDPDAAETIYLAGIAAGDSHCHHNLAELLCLQDRVPEALHHYRLAAAAGDQLATRALGELEQRTDDD